jgi:phosphoenolpyruvate carboxylase
MIEWRLEQTLAKSPFGEFVEGAYAALADFEADVRLLADSLQTHHDARLAAGEPQRWLDRIAVFGFHLARLDIRQDSRRYVNVMNEVLAALNLCPNYAELGETERQQLLTQSMGCSQPLDIEKLTDLAQDTVKLFRLLRRAVAAYGEHVIGGHVVSMTHQPSDLLTVMWLWEWAGAAYETELSESTATALRVIPLFETIDDLQRAPTILEGLLAQPAFGPYLDHAGRRLIVMIGYSDSTKDGGYLSACWRLYRAQSELCEIAERHNVRLTFFHGRGGSLGRGGGPAARSILSLPPKALGGSLRITEQGEVLAERYDDPQIAYRHLEQMTWAMLLSAATPVPDIPDAWRNVMDKLATRSYKAYREFVEQPQFIEYFAQGTPIEEIENLPIASRPARRGERRLEDLRAIPWVFSWTQNRCMIPAWYGLGSALEEMQLAGGDDWRVTLEMYRQWPFFQATIDNAILALAKTDLYVGQRYATLVESPELRQRIFSLIAAEHERSRRNILAIVGGTDLLSNTPWLQRSIEFRNPYVDPLNLIQVEWFRRLRGGTESIDAAEIHDLLRLTVQGVAAGMRTTG